MTIILKPVRKMYLSLTGFAGHVIHENLN